MIERADGCRVWDTAGVERVDWIMGWGSLILGHRPQPVVDALKECLDFGFAYQYESPANADLADLICEFVPSVDKVRLCNSGLEATQYAIRVARAVTRRRKVLKFEGHFHGLNDFLVWGVDCTAKLGDQDADGSIRPIPGSPGIPDELGDLLVIVPFNDIDAVAAAFARHGDDLAAVILEPVALNIGCVYPEPGFLQSLRDLCTERGVVLIFDEILTGFRGADGGAQDVFGVSPDLTCLGKALGSGAPIAALGGSRQYMDMLSPVGDLDMAGTNTARRIGVVAALAALRAMREADAASVLRQSNDYFIEAVRGIFADRGVPAYVQGWGGRIGIHVGSEQRPRTYRDVVSLWNGDYHRRCYQLAHEKYRLFGFLLPLTICPEPVTLSLAHDRAALDQTLDRLDGILASTPYRAG
ncbi:aspartate aminotransferase family protein [Krasilnikovia sp. M28-CT-15]|uniref:aspartate aminotransferase family protein n=1 Tax=Krasilnikovia sp. M28-CT-15 TaxID=3373540 RepID=UPI00399D44A5